MFHYHSKLPHSRPPRADGGQKRHRILRGIGWFLLAIVVGVAAVRPFLPRIVRWYVVRTIDQNPLYHGKIQAINIHLLKGSYEIEDLRLIKLTGQAPYPLFKTRRMELAIQWNALLHGKVVGQVLMESPEVNFIDAPSDADSQSGSGGAWLQILTDLFPFKINRLQVHNAAIHFRTFQKKKSVDVFLGQLDGSIDNLTNIRDEITPLITTVQVQGLAMEQAAFEYQMKLDPFSYRPTFHMAVRLMGLDVTKINELALLYGGFAFKSGWFDLVLEVDARNGAMSGYVKPLFRNLTVFDLPRDVVEDNPLQFVWSAIVGAATTVLKNPPRDQFGTLIPFTGDMSAPRTDILATVGNVLRNAFVRAYLPKFQNGESQTDGLQFAPATLSDPTSAGDTP